MTSAEIPGHGTRQGPLRSYNHKLSHDEEICRDARIAPTLFRKVDCLQVPVPNLEAGLAFYCDRLGHELAWRTETQAGLRMLVTDAEIVLQTERPTPEVDVLVASVEEAVATIVDAGGDVVVPPFDIRIGRCAVIQDPWGTSSPCSI
jgi:predicted enzyme related to lactoylglutathione lyase